MNVPGSLRIIGLGPGGAEWLTPEASEWIASASDLIGYAPYLERLPMREGQTRHPSGNGAEMERARFALQIVEDGHRAAIVCGGDPGIFAMAAAVFEAIEEGKCSWRDLDIAVSPGISAMQAAAARAGAPLGHDFCAISLSDNLKPWSLVEKRLAAAASADFVIALYNPASAARPLRIHDAFSLLRSLKPGATPVVFARAVGRQDEDISVATLTTADPARADMSTLIIVGSSATRIIPRNNLTPVVYTPRQASR
jgi:precorrin-3B C17-methyltransferase